jgi:ketosteroid isomerase-like protein
MKYTLFAISAILTFQLSQAQGSDADKAQEVSGMGVKSVEDTLVQIEHDWGNALLKANVAAWSRYLGDDWVLTYSDGTLVTKPMALADLKEGALRIESFQLDDVKVRVYGDAAVVTGLITEKSKFRDKDTSGVRRFTDVFVKRDGRWQAVASHESEVSAPK